MLKHKVQKFLLLTLLMGSVTVTIDTTNIISQGSLGTETSLGILWPVGRKNG